MAKSSNNVVTYGLQGLIGRMLVFKQMNGKTVVANRPRKSTKPYTAEQLEIQQRFKEAALYAQAAIQDASLKERYEEAASSGQSAFNAAFSDYFKPPVLSEADSSAYTGQAGQLIKVRAVSMLEVTEVKVSIKQSGGTLVEEGQAVKAANGLDWEYETTQANASFSGSIITFTAKGLPGNSMVLEVTV